MRFTPAIALLAALAVIPGPAAAFDPNRILDDAELRRADAMSYEQIRAFLADRGGLASVQDVDPIDGNVKDAARLINDAAKRYQVNPKYLLALIQKESSAVETAVPAASQLDWATGYALCDGCYKTAELAQKYRGFARQVDAGAGWIEWFWKTSPQDSSLRQPGQAYEISGTTVVPQNMATAALYTYTPHLHGNQLLWRIIDRWFGVSGSGMRYPDGTLVRNPENGAVALIQGSKFRPITKASVLSSRFDARRIVNVTKEEFERMDKTMRGRPVRFADLSLVRDESDTVWLLVGSKRRPVASAEAFAKIGFNPEEVEDVAAEDIADYDLGTPITAGDSFPSGALLQDTKTGGVYFAENGVRRPVVDKALLQTNFPGKKLVPTSPAALERIPLGSPVTFDEGVLVKLPNSPTVYVVSGGQLRIVPDEATFLALGFSFKNVQTAGVKALSLLPLGLPVSTGGL